MAFRSKKQSVKDLIGSIEAAAAHEEYDPRADLAVLLEQYNKLRPADFGRVLEAMCNKYDTEWSLIHAALVEQALQGEIDAIKLLREDLLAASGEGSAVNIVDDIG